MRIEDDLNELSEEELLAEEDSVPEWVQKYFVRAVAIFLVLLMLSFVYLNYPVIGQLVSKPVNQNTLELKNVTVHFDDEPLSMIMSSYRLEVETPFCLQGTREGQDYFITSAYVPTISDQSRTHVTHAACQETLILFHTHPYKSCLASATDLNTLASNQERDSNIIMVIMCEPNRFSLYT